MIALEIQSLIEGLEKFMISPLGFFGLVPHVKLAILTSASSLRRPFTSFKHFGLIHLPSSPSFLYQFYSPTKMCFHYLPTLNSKRDILSSSSPKFFFLVLPTAARVNKLSAKDEKFETRALDDHVCCCTWPKFTLFLLHKEGQGRALVVTKLVAQHFDRKVISICFCIFL
jgi:hypothetical protein